ncbi:DUF1566 domain-containing protein [bacterium]|nr:DUF1566 domain-containing protein [bacterium]
MYNCADRSRSGESGNGVDDGLQLEGTPRIVSLPEDEYKEYLCRRIDSVDESKKGDYRDPLLKSDDNLSPEELCELCEYDPEDPFDNPPDRRCNDVVELDGKSWTVCDTWYRTCHYCALKYVKKLRHPKFGGYGDWRLPTSNELMSIVDLESDVEWLGEPLFVHDIFKLNYSYVWACDAWMSKDDVPPRDRLYEAAVFNYTNLTLSAWPPAITNSATILAIRP